MFNPDKPTPKQVAQLAAVQQKRLSDLQQLPHWSDSQFEEVLFCMQTWSEKHQQWVHDVAAIGELTFDVRVPDKFAPKLDQLVKNWRDNGYPAINHQQANTH